MSLYQVSKVSDHVYGSMDFFSFDDFSIGFWNCSNSAIFLVFVFHLISSFLDIYIRLLIVLNERRMGQLYQTSWLK